MDHLYSPLLDADQPSAEVTPELHRHIDALRLRHNDTVRVFNGKGLVATCTVARKGSAIDLLVTDRMMVPKPPALVLALGSLDHRDRFEFAIEKAVELGATTIVPLQTTRVQRMRSSPERLRAKAEAALTQCGSAWLPEISANRTIAELLADLDPDCAVLVGDAGGSAPTAVGVRGSVWCMVGPEGGFTEEEMSELQADPRTTLIAIGRLRLRAETAAIAMLAMCAGLRS